MKYDRITTNFVVLLFLAGCGGGEIDQEAALDAMVAEEIAFGQRSAEEGTRAAFLAYLADDSITFQPEPADARAFQMESPDNGSLTWEPAYAEISADGTLGYTTGPWTFESDERLDNSRSHGHFVTIWKIQTDGAWKVVLDIGNTYPDPFPAGGPVERRTNREAVEGVDPVLAGNELLALDRALSMAAAPIDSLMASTDPDVRVYRNGERPARGREAALELLNLTQTGEPRPAGTTRWDPLDASVSGSGDLGYSYGYAGISEDSTSYLRIWRRRPGGEWKIVLDVVI